MVIKAKETLLVLAWLLLGGLACVFLIEISRTFLSYTPHNRPLLMRTLVQILELGLLGLLYRQVFLGRRFEPALFEKRFLAALWLLLGLKLCVALPMGLRERPPQLHALANLDHYRNFLGFLPSWDSYAVSLWLLVGLATWLAWFFKHRLADVDEILLPCMVFMFYLGLVLLVRLGPDLARASEAALRQILYFLLASLLGGLVLLPGIRERLMKLAAYPYLLLMLSLALLMSTFYFGTALSGGKALWIRLGGLTFQPVEISKILFVLVVAIFLERKHFSLSIRKGWGTLTSFALICASLFAVLYLQRDFGPILLLLLTCFWLLLTTTRLWRLLPAGLVGAVLLVGLVLLTQKPGMVYNRLMDSIDPLHFSGQLTKGLWAQGAAGSFGSGLGQSKAYTIPVIESDYIFSALLAEQGFAGALLMLGLLLLFSWRGAQMAQVIDRANRRDATFLLGLVMVLFIQAFLIIGGNLALLPLTGITLPFVSAGGTSLVINVLVVFLMLALVKRHTREVI